MSQPSHQQIVSRLTDGRFFLICQVAAMLLLLYVAYVLTQVNAMPAASAIDRPAADQHQQKKRSARHDRTALLPSAPAPGQTTAIAQPAQSRPAGARDIVRRLEEKRAKGHGIPGDYLMGFATLADFENFLTRAEKNGVRVVDYSRRLLYVRFHADNLAASRNFLNSVNARDLDENTEVLTPDEPDMTMAPPLISYQGFGTGALGWLGVSGGNEGWGSGVVVAVLDTMVENHPALDQSRVVRIDLLTETADDGNGAYRGHGTAVAAIIAGHDENAPGMAPQADILAIRVLDSNGRGDGFTVAKGIMTAVDNGADIINLSLGSYSDSHVLREAVNYALNQGVAVVASTGNDGVDQVMYPARHEGVIGVGAVDAAEQHLAFSNFGAGVDIMAPGYEVATAWRDSQYVRFSGTSAAAPFVAGAIGALLSENPGMPPAQAATLTLQYANDSGQPGADDRFGHGILNWQRIAERQTPGIYDLAVADYYMPAPGLPAADQAMPVVVTIQNRGTEYITDANVRITINGQTEYHSIEGLAPNQSTGILTEIPRSRISASGMVTISSSADAGNLNDQYPANNNRSDDFIFVEMCPYIQ